MNEADKKLKAQLDSQAVKIQALQRQIAAQGARGPEAIEEDPGAPLPQFQQPNMPGQAPQPQYQQVDPNMVVLQAITHNAAKQAASQVKQETETETQTRERIKARMERLVSDYPALKQDDSRLVAAARDSYARIATENPELDEATRYELAVREAASLVGARPVSAPIEDMDWTMGSNRNPALPTRTSRSRLTPQIIANAKLMGINVDPNNPEGKKNLAELSEYSARFNADVNEDQYRYQ